MKTAPKPAITSSVAGISPNSSRLRALIELLTADAAELDLAHEVVGVLA